MLKHVEPTQKEGGGGGVCRVAGCMYMCKQGCMQGCMQECM